MLCLGRTTLNASATPGMYPSYLNPPPLQVFMTTHSPVAVRELAAAQLHVLRRYGDQHYSLAVGDAGDVQGTIRRFPDALLATTIFVCEGASEVGLMRGFDQWRVTNGLSPMAAHGCALVDGGGSELFSRALAFQALGFRVATLRDSDVHPTPELEAKFLAAGGQTYRWRNGRALEDELFETAGPLAASSSAASCAVSAPMSSVSAKARSRNGSLGSTAVGSKARIMSALWREMRKKGFCGQIGVISEWARRRRLAEKADQSALARTPSARSIARLMTLARDDLSKSDAVVVATIESNVPDLITARTLIDDFQAMIRSKAAEKLDSWVADAKTSLVRSFANGVEKDIAAVRNAIISPWSNGQTEGQITKLKLIKRQMYGRAKIDLLQARLIGAA